MDPIDPVHRAADAIARAAHLDPDGPLRPGDSFFYGWSIVAGRRRPGHCALVELVPGYDGPMPESVLRARRDIGTGRYKLDGGGLDDDDVGNCSGALCEWLGIERVQPCAGYGSINTNAAIADAEGERKIFRPVPTLVPIRWSSIGLIDCTAAHPRDGAVGRRNGAMWGRRKGVALRLVNDNRA